MYGEEEDKSEELPYTVYQAEGESLAKQEEYVKAIESFTKALDLQTNDKTCLVARAKCYLQLGQSEAALQDAESSLKEDKNYHKGLYEKANALYQMGDFEYALVYYHRGKKLRPDLTKFDLGISKAQEAINNSIGTPEQCHLEKIGDLTWFQQQVDLSKQKAGKNRKMVARPTVQSKSKAAAAAQGNVASDKTMKHLLGELYEDRVYISELLRDQSLVMGSKSTEMISWLQEGLSYLDTRADFWRQQKPMYARKREKQLRRIKPTLTRPVGPAGKDYIKIILKSLEDIDTALDNGDAEGSLKEAQAVMKTVQSLNERDLMNKSEFVASLYSAMGTAYLELGEVDKALDCHLKDYHIVNEKRTSRDALSRALDNLGRVYQIKSEFQKAIEYWQQKLPLVESPEESTWLYHEIGRSHFELGKFEDAKDYGTKSLESAKTAQDYQWQMNATVLIAQSQKGLNDLLAAIESFESALELAGLAGDDQAKEAIKMAIKDVNYEIVQGVSSGDQGQGGDNNDDDHQGGGDNTAAANNDTTTEEDQAVANEQNDVNDSATATD